MLFHGQPHDMRVRAAADLPRLLAELPKDKEWLPNLHGVSGGLLESDLGGEPAALVHAELAPYAHLFLVDGIGAGLAGSVERPLGNLAMLAGDLDGAAGHFERALDGQHRDRGSAGGRQHPPRVRRAVAAAWRPG